MAQLTPTKLALPSTLHTLVAAAGGGDTFPNDGRTWVHVKNGGGSPITVTFDDVGSSTPIGAEQFDPDVAVTVAAGAERICGPFPTERFGGETGLVAITYSGVTSVTVGAYRL